MQKKLGFSRDFDLRFGVFHLRETFKRGERGRIRFGEEKTTTKEEMQDCGVSREG